MEASLENIQKKWSDLRFVVVQYADSQEYFKVTGVDEILVQIEDHQVTVQTMLATRHVNFVRASVEAWEKKLLLMSEIVDEWLMCQRSWIYLENIFNAPDIQKQLPSESRKFLMVNKFWKDHMLRCRKNPVVTQQCSSNELLLKF